jgi:hypothetical protein
MKRHKIRLRTYFHDLSNKLCDWNLELKLKDNNVVKKKKITLSNIEVKKNLFKKIFLFLQIVFHKRQMLITSQFL